MLLCPCTRWMLLGLLLVPGCGSTTRRAEIPAGHWVGEGRFVFYEVPAPSAEAAPAPAKRVTGTYPTDLKIEPVPALGPGAVRLEILSRRGEYPELGEGDRTHLIAVLRPEWSADDGKAAVYRLVEFGISLDAAPAPEPTDDDERSIATCLTDGNDIVVQAHYMKGFLDSFRFRGAHVYKVGSFAEEPARSVLAWSERLRRQP